MKDPVTPLVAAMLVIAAASFVPAQAEQTTTLRSTSPVLVELFTSQGCNSCPPADRVLGDLKSRPDVLALSFHVTYWDRLGWEDTFGLEASTNRQRAYATWLDSRGLYTPQMVIGGRIDVVGSRGGRVREAIELLSRNAQQDLPITIADDQLRVGESISDRATIWLFGIDHEHDVSIWRGENRGRTIRYHNVVREVTEIGRWSGGAVNLALPLERLVVDGRDSAAIVVQRTDTGEILATRQIDLSQRH